MKTVAIICEYNPFHNGHLHQIKKTREILGENTKIVCIMSGNFVQRGDIAIAPKHIRAKMAVLNGADIVFELPLPYSMCSAENFAKGAVHILNRFKSINYLSFGSECGNIDILCAISEILICDDFSHKLKENLKSGISYPRALDTTLSEYDKSFSEIVKNPNNTLGIEYIKALILSKSSIKPMTITRFKAMHDSDFAVDNIASATHIRQNEVNEVVNLMPKSAYTEFKKACDTGFAPTKINNIEQSILSFLKRKDTHYFAQILDISEGLEHKIVAELKVSQSIDELISNIKSKRYTQSRIRRIILNAYLEITKDYVDIMPEYAKVLAFNDGGREFLKTLKDGDITIINKPSANYNLSEGSKKLLRLTEISTDLYSMCFSEGLRVSSYEQKNSPIYVK